MFYRIPSSFIFFLSGIFVAVGVNLITSNTAGIFNSSGSNTLMFGSIPWLVCAAFINILAVHLETAEKDYENSSLKNLSYKECSELKKSIYTKYSTKLIAWTLLIFLSFGVGVLFSINKPETSQYQQFKEKMQKESTRFPTK